MNADLYLHHLREGMPATLDLVANELGIEHWAEPLPTGVTVLRQRFEGRFRAKMLDACSHFDPAKPQPFWWFGVSPDGLLCTDCARGTLGGIAALARAKSHVLTYPCDLCHVKQPRAAWGVARSGIISVVGQLCDRCLRGGGPR